MRKIANSPRLKLTGEQTTGNNRKELVKQVNSS